MQRVAAPELEQIIGVALRQQFPQAAELNDQGLIAAYVERIIISEAKISVRLTVTEAGQSFIELPRTPKRTFPSARIETDNRQPTREPDASLVQALARAHSWRKALAAGAHQSVEDLAATVEWNPKVIRKALRLAFLAPDITEAILDGSQPPAITLSKLQGISGRFWDEQRRLLGLPTQSHAGSTKLPGLAI